MRRKKADCHSRDSHPDTASQSLGVDIVRRGIRAAALLCGAAGAALIASSCFPANATVMSMSLAGTSFEAFYDDSDIKDLRFVLKPADGIPERGDLYFTTIFRPPAETNNYDFGNEPSIAFDNFPGTGSTSFGLRLFLHNTILNLSGKAMTGLDMRVFDIVPESRHPNSGGHPGYVHFHKGTSDGSGAASCTQQLFAPFTMGGSGKDFDRLCDPDVPAPPLLGVLSGQAIALSGGTIASGGSVTFSDFGLHEYDDSQRDFEFDELPTFAVPEPTALISMLAGLVGLSVARRRR